MQPWFKNARVWVKMHFSKGLLIGIILSVLLHLMMIVALLQKSSSALELSPENGLLINATLMAPATQSMNIQQAVTNESAAIAASGATKIEALPENPVRTESNNALNQATYSISDAVESPIDAPPVMLDADNGNSNAQGANAQGANSQGNSTQGNSLETNTSVNDELGEALTSERSPINPDAYQYVETYFDVRTDINAPPQASPAGNAKIIFQLTQNNTQYQIDSFTAPKGFAALFMANLTQKSVGNFTAQGLQPLQYDYQFGDKPDKTYHATFDWAREKLRMTTIKGTQIVNLTNGAQDLLSFMYQLMYVPPLNNLQFNITNGKKFALYSYLFEGEELVETKMGALNTIHIARENDDHDEKTDVWLATDYQHLPVKIRKTEKNGKVYELLATKILTKAN